MLLRRRTNTVILALSSKLSQIEWKNIIKTLDNPNTAYKYLFHIFFKTYDKYFSKVKIKIKAKTNQNPWITKGIRKSSKKKQKFMKGFLKSVLHRMNSIRKIISIFLKQSKRKQRYNSNKLLKCTGDIKKHGML